MAVERKVVDWNGDRSLLPAIPVDDSSEQEIAEFTANMESFISGWNPTPPEGEGWILVEKDWHCAATCNNCGIEHDPQKGGCVFQGVWPKSVWERPEV